MAGGGATLGAGTNFTIAFTDVAATTLLGRGSAAGAGAPVEITVGTGLSLSGLTLSSTVVGISDGDKGDITVSAGGTVWAVDNDAITYAKMQNVSATDRLLGQSTAGAGDTEEIVCTAAGRAILDDADAAAQRATLSADVYALPLFFTTAATASEVLLLHIAADPFTIPANFATPNSRGAVGTNPTGSFAIDVTRQVNATGAFATIGTITISVAGAFTFATAAGTAKAIAVNDVLKFIAPAGVDATIANVAITIRGSR